MRIIQNIIQMNKTADILLKAFQEVLNVTNQFMKYAAEEERKEKQRKSKQPPKVYFEKEGPYPQVKTQQNDNNKKHITKNADKINNKNGESKPNISDHKIKNIYEKYMNAPLQEKNSKKPIKQSLKQNLQDKQSNYSQQDQKKNKKANLQKSKEQVNNKNKKDQKPPEKPKAPISSFLRFNKAHMEEVKRNYPHMSQPDLVSVTGHMWSQSPPDVKKKYQQQYARDKQRYDAAMIQYYRKYPQQKSRKQLQLQKTLNNK